MTNQNLNGATGVFLIMGQWRYGAGHTLEEAKKNFTSQGGGLTKGLTLIEFDDRTEYHGVDQMGRFEYKRLDEIDPDAPAKFRYEGGRRMTEVQPGKRIPANR
jgi:hypothetical protein